MPPECVAPLVGFAATEIDHVGSRTGWSVSLPLVAVLEAAVGPADVEDIGCRLASTRCDHHRGGARGLDDRDRDDVNHRGSPYRSRRIVSGRGGRTATAASHQDLGVGRRGQMKHEHSEESGERQNGFHNLEAGNQRSGRRTRRTLQSDLACADIFAGRRRGVPQSETVWLAPRKLNLDSVGT